ncbi:helix-turn-helix domain-containing protein [Domibacillus sp. PGB-M46]|uniref:helix-turn-helix domain-containing protein n=1 Tax=Domibacillus sp. PGB-M46 TaxID=2910255 RepID=UPI001F5799D6|nr:helix-turn-helix domain-containing protein [Domibacillus sp. PGB-M46]MCI2256495.1 helix-turn-helix domain-containing protein [Domibacillus sp. PGB-M46]
MIIVNWLKQYDWPLCLYGPRVCLGRKAKSCGGSLWGGHQGLLFSKEAIEHLIETMPKTPEGLTLNQAAEYLQTNRNFIAAYIKEGILPASEGQVKGRTIPLITESDLKESSELHEKKIWEDRLSQRQYYNKKAKEAVYQRFSSPSIFEARLMCKGLRD